MIFIYLKGLGSSGTPRQLLNLAGLCDTRGLVVCCCHIPAFASTLFRFALRLRRCSWHCALPGFLVITSLCPCTSWPLRCMCKALPIFLILFLILLKVNYDFLCAEEITEARQSQGTFAVVPTYERLSAFVCETAGTDLHHLVSTSQSRPFFSAPYSERDGVRESPTMEMPRMSQDLERTDAKVCMVRWSLATVLRSRFCSWRSSKIEVAATSVSRLVGCSAMELSTTSAFSSGLGSQCRTRSRSWIRPQSSTKIEAIPSWQSWAASTVFCPSTASPATSSCSYDAQGRWQRADLYERLWCERCAGPSAAPTYYCTCSSRIWKCKCTPSSSTTRWDLGSTDRCTRHFLVCSLTGSSFRCRSTSEITAARIEEGSGRVSSSRVTGRSEKASSSRRRIDNQRVTPSCGQSQESQKGCISCYLPLPG